MHMGDMHCSRITVWDLCASQIHLRRERERHMLVLSDDQIIVLRSSTSDCILSWLRRAEFVTMGKWMRHAWACINARHKVLYCVVSVSSYY